MTVLERVHATPPDVNDRCDSVSCGAKALVTIKLKTGDLVFCGHHYDKLPPSFLEIMLGVCDTRVSA